MVALMLQYGFIFQKKSLIFLGCVYLANAFIIIYVFFCQVVNCNTVQWLYKINYNAWGIETILDQFCIVLCLFEIFQLRTWIMAHPDVTVHNQYNVSLSNVLLDNEMLIRCSEPVSPCLARISNLAKTCLNMFWQWCHIPFMSDDV